MHIYIYIHDSESLSGNIRMQVSIQKPPRATARARAYVSLYLHRDFHSISVYFIMARMSIFQYISVY